MKFILREEILKPHSKKQCNKIIRWVGFDKARFTELIHLLLYDKDPKVVQWAAWPISYIVVEYPDLAKPWFKKMTALLTKEGAHPAVRRSIVRIFQFIDIPKNIQGSLTDLCFGFLRSKEESIAVKVFSMCVLAKITQEHPDLKNELRIVIEDILPYSSPGFRARARCILKELNTIAH